MIDFKPITLKDKNLITSYTLTYAPQDCDFSFANLCAWHFSNDSSFAEVENCLVIRFRMEDNRVIYLMPIGQGNIMHVINLLEREASAEGQPLRLQGPYPDTRDKLEKYYPTLFEYDIHRDYADYIYSRSALAELKGKYYQPKRNHVNKFVKEHVYRYTMLTPEMLPQCLELESHWCMEHDYVVQASMKAERRALTYNIHHYEELGLLGGAIWVGDKMLAFTFGSPVNETTFATHVEKATMKIDGTYSIINKEFAAHLPEQYLYINREEDLGLPGLRQAKLSYHPDILLEKCIAIKK